MSYPVAASSPSQHTPANSGGNHTGASSSPLPYTPGSVASRSSNYASVASPRRYVCVIFYSPLPILKPSQVPRAE